MEARQARQARPKGDWRSCLLNLSPTHTPVHHPAPAIGAPNTHRSCRSAAGKGIIRSDLVSSSRLERQDATQVGGSLFLQFCWLDKRQQRTNSPGNPPPPFPSPNILSRQYRHHQRPSRKMHKKGPNLPPPLNLVVSETSPKAVASARPITRLGRCTRIYAQDER